MRALTAVVVSFLVSCGTNKTSSDSSQTGGSGPASGGGPAAPGGGAASTGGGTASSGVVGMIEAEIPGSEKQTVVDATVLMPKGWTREQYDSGIISYAAPAVGDSKCLVYFLPKVAAKADRFAQALSLFKGLFSDAPDLDMSQQYPSKTYRGLSVEGHDLDGVDAPVLNGNGSRGLVALFTAGNETWPVIGLEQVDNRCLGGFHFEEEWPWKMVLYGMRLKGPTPQFERLRDAILGKWDRANRNIYLADIYAANGRWGTAASYQTFQTINADEVLRTTTTYSGDGVWRFSEGVLETLRDDNANSLSTTWVRVIEDKSENLPGGWLPRIYRIKKPVSPGGVYESFLQKEVK